MNKIAKVERLDYSSNFDELRPILEELLTKNDGLVVTIERGVYIDNIWKEDKIKSIYIYKILYHKLNLINQLL